MSGQSLSIHWTARRPSLTETTWMSSWANVSSITRWIVTLSSARRSVFDIACLWCLDAWLHGAPDEINDLLHRAPRRKDTCDADRLQRLHIRVRDDSADKDAHI